jgi:hypothetical protein
VLFTGKLRRNLDPFSNHGDDALWNALTEVRTLILDFLDILIFIHTKKNTVLAVLKKRFVYT